MDFQGFRPLLVFRLDFEEVIKHLLCMIRRFNFMIDFHQGPFRVNKEAFSFFDAFIFFRHLPSRICQQTYSETVLVSVFFVACHSVLTDSQNNHPSMFKLVQAFAESPGFNGSAGGVVFGIKEKH